MAQVETEALKQELYDKQELVRQASAALASLEHQYQEQLTHARQQHAQETQQLNQQIQTLQKVGVGHGGAGRGRRGRDQFRDGSAQGRLKETDQTPKNLLKQSHTRTKLTDFRVNKNK